MVDGDKMETLHVYVSREEMPPPFDYVTFLLLPACCMVLFVILFLSLFIPTPRNDVAFTISVQAVLLSPVTKTEAVGVIPTGIKTFPQVSGRGLLTLYNGSAISQNIPQGMVFTSTNGVEIVTDTSVFVPSGNPPSFGIATVFAHAMVGGKNGNIRSLALNTVVGASIYIRNLGAFTGGRDRYSVKVITSQDVLKAATSVAPKLQQQVMQSLGSPLDPSCGTQTKRINTTVSVSVTCRGVSYRKESVITAINAYKKNRGIGTFSHVQIQVLGTLKGVVKIYVTADWQPMLMRPFRTNLP